MTAYYQIKSPLSQITEERTTRYLASLSALLDEPLQKVTLQQYLSSDFALLFVASGGSEGFFLDIFDELKDRPCFILTSGDSNSLAASMEILSFLNKHGGRGEILHGDIRQVAEKIILLKNACHAVSSLKGKKLGCIGAPSDWLIASNYSADAVKKKLGIDFAQFSMEELLDEIALKSFEADEYTEDFLRCDFPKDQVLDALYVYGAFRRIIERYGLLGISVRCFDLLDTVHTTGCLGLSILNSQGLFGGCEGDMPSLLSMVILGTVTNEPVFLCNPSRFDAKTGEATFAHCTIPVTMLKEYCLNTHFESGIGVAVQGKFVEGPCTIFKCEGDLSRYHAQEGLILPVTFSENLCRTQIRLQLDDFSYFLTRPINNHHIICKGNHKAQVDEFFRILG